MVTNVNDDSDEAFAMVYRKENIQPNTRRPRGGSKWAPPISNEIKINFDAAVNREDGKVGIGVIARDCEGKVLVAKAKTLLHNWSPELCEARAALEPIYMAKDEGYRNIILEGDA
ncbi:Switch 2 [Bienertia sinuspersici]